MNSPDDTLLKRHNHISHPGPPPLSGWASFRPSAKPNVQSCSSPSPSAQPSPGSRDSTFFNPGPMAMEGQISCRRLEGFKTTLGLSPGHLPTFAGDSCLDKYYFGKLFTAKFFQGLGRGQQPVVPVLPGARPGVGLLGPDPHPDLTQAPGPVQPTAGGNFFPWNLPFHVISLPSCLE